MQGRPKKGPDPALSLENLKAVLEKYLETKVCYILIHRNLSAEERRLHMHNLKIWKMPLEIGLERRPSRAPPGAIL